MFFYMFAQLAKHCFNDSARPKRITMIYPLSDQIVSSINDIVAETHNIEDPNMKQLLADLNLNEDEYPVLRILGVPLPEPESIHNLRETILYGGDWVTDYFRDRFPIFADQFTETEVIL